MAATVDKHQAQHDRAALQVALNRHLAERGDLCLGKFDWPIDVNAVDFANGTRDAVQMPVLERLGLVSSSDGTVTMHRDDGSQEPVAAKRYELTRVGKMFYVPRETSTRVGDKQIQHHADLCAGKLSLERLVSVDVNRQGRQGQATVQYTYRFAPAQWTRFDEALKVFPMIARVEQGQGSMQMTQRFELIDGKWVAASGL